MAPASQPVTIQVKAEGTVAQPETSQAVRQSKPVAEDDEMLQEMSDGEIMDGEEPDDVIKMNKMRQIAEVTLKKH